MNNYWIIYQIFSIFLATRVGLMSIKASLRKSFHFRDIFKGFSLFFSILLVYLLGHVLGIVGLIFLIVPGIYLFVSYVFATYLIVDKGLGIWDALETSRIQVTKKWFNVAFVFLAQPVLIALSIFTLFIGLIWILPLNFILLEVLYRKLFGISEDSLLNKDS